MATPEEFQQEIDAYLSTLSELRKKHILLADQENTDNEEQNSVRDSLRAQEEVINQKIIEATEQRKNLIDHLNTLDESERADTQAEIDALTSSLSSLENSLSQPLQIDNANGTAQQPPDQAIGEQQVGLLQKILDIFLNPKKDTFAEENKKEQDAKDDKTRSLLLRVAEGVEEIGQGFGEEVEVGGLGFGGILLLIAGAVTGFVIQLVAELAIFIGRIGRFIKNIGKGVFGKILTTFDDIRIFFGKIGTWIKKKIPKEWVTKFDEGVDAFRATLGKIGTKFRNFFKIGDKVDDTADGARKGLKIFDKIGDVFRSISKFGGKTVNFAGDVLKAGGKIFSNVVDMIGGLVKPFTKIFKGGMKFGKSFGKVLGPLGIVISIIDGIVQSVMGFISGFKDGGGLVGGLKGAIEGLFNSIVGDLVNMGADLLGWIVKKLGFGDKGQAIMDFDFLGKLKEWYAVISEKLTGAIDEIKIAFMNVEFFIKDITSFFTETIPNIFNSIVTKLKNVWATIKEKLAIFNPLQLIKDGIIKWMPNIFGLKEKVASLLGTSVQAVRERTAERSENISGFGKMMKEHVLTKIIEILPSAFGIREFAAEHFGVPMVTNEEKEGKANAKKLAKKEESDRKKFVKIRQREIEVELKAEGVSKAEIKAQKDAIKEQALSDFDNSYSTIRDSGGDIIVMAKESLKSTQRDLIDAEKQRKQREKESAKASIAVAGGSTQVVSTNNVTSSTQVGIKKPATDTNFLQTQAGF